MARLRLGELLVKAGVLAAEKLEFALREQRRTGVRLGQILVDHGLLEESTLYHALARMAGLERLNLRTITVEPEAADMVTGGWALENRALPVALNVEKRILKVVVADANNVGPSDELAFRTGYRVEMILGSDSELERLVRYYFFNEPLRRETKAAVRPGHPTTDRVRITSNLISRGIEEERNQVQAAHDLEEPEPGIPLTSEQHALMLLKPVFDHQQRSAMELRAIFDLCVERGIITPDEYFQRLARIPD